MSKVTLLNSSWGATESQPSTPRHVAQCLRLTQAFRASRRKAGAGESACLSHTFLLSIIFALQYPIYAKPCWVTNCDICNIGLPCQMFAFKVWDFFPSL